MEDHHQYLSKTVVHQNANEMKGPIPLDFPNSPHKKEFQSLWLEAGNLRALSANAGKFMLINRVVSMVDAILLAKKWNNNHAMKLSLNAYPDLRNKSGLGGVKLSLYWE